MLTNRNFVEKLYKTFNQNNVVVLTAHGPSGRITVRLYGSGKKKKPVNVHGGEKTKKLKRVCDRNTCVATANVPLPCVPKDCKTDAVRGPVYDDECRRPYVNPCLPNIKPCLPVNRSINYKIQPCGRPNIMDLCPVPDCPYDPPKKMSMMKKLLYSLVALIVVGGIQKLLTLGLFDSNAEVVRTVKKRRKSYRPQVILKNPANSSDIPSDVPYLIIGGGTASHSAFKAIREADAGAKVLVISNEPYMPYARPPLCKEMVTAEDRSTATELRFTSRHGGNPTSIFLEPAEYFVPCAQLNNSAEGGVSIATGWNVTKLDPVNQTAQLDDGTVIKYGKCLIAAGAYPKNLPAFEDIEDDELADRITLFRGIFDFQELEDIVASGAESVAVIGGGFLASEIACALVERGKGKLKVFQLFRGESALDKILPKYLSEWTTKQMEEQGVIVKKQTQVEDAVIDNHSLKLALNSGKVLSADQVIVAVGVHPNTDLAGSAGLETDCERGGYTVNPEMEARVNLFVAGDCASYYEHEAGRRRIEHYHNAVVTGRVAGQNMAGGKALMTTPISYGSGLGPLGFQAVGKVSSCMPTVGVFAKAGLVDSQSGRTPDPAGDFKKGVVFYFEGEVIVGIVVWNLPDRMETANRVLRFHWTYDKVNDAASMFNIYST